MTEEKMLAVVAYRPEDYHLERVALSKLSAQEAVIKVKATGICASDAKCYKGAARFWKGLPAAYVKPPFIPGHEFIGEVVEIGSQVQKKWNIQVGDKVIVEQILPCWNCRFCNSGKYWMCERNYVFGYHGGIDDGAWAEYMKFPVGSILHKVPKDLPDEWGAMIEPLSCAIDAVERATIGFANTVVISGTGSIDLSARPETGQCLELFSRGPTRKGKFLPTEFQRDRKRLLFSLTLLMIRSGV